MKWPEFTEVFLVVYFSVSFWISIAICWNSLIFFFPVTSNLPLNVYNIFFTPVIILFISSFISISLIWIFSYISCTFLFEHLEFSYNKCFNVLVCYFRYLCQFQFRCDWFFLFIMSDVFLFLCMPGSLRISE